MDWDLPANLSRRQVIGAGAAALAVTQLVPTAEAQTAGSTTPAGYILVRLRQHNVTTLFGIPGATCDPIFAAAAAHSMATVVTSSDFEAGYAADGYARVRGLGAVAVTYGVGMLSLIATISGAYAERSPVVVINGGPSREDIRLQREFGTYFTHSNGHEQSDLNMFREVTAFAERISTVADVPGLVDRAIKTALTKKRPVYIEIAKDVWDAPCPAPQGAIDVSIPATGTESDLAAAIIARLRSAVRPALLLGIEIDRYGLAGEVTNLVAKLQLPWASTLLAKSVIAETTPGFAGVYTGEHSLASVTKIVEQSDALLAIGCVFGRQYRKLVTGAGNALISIANDKVRIGRHDPADATLGAMIARLAGQDWSAGPAIAGRTGLGSLSYAERRRSVQARTPSAAEASEPGLTYDETLSAVGEILDDRFIVITDTSLSMYPAADLNVSGARAFVCNAVWQSIGYSLGAAVGVALGQSRRPLVLCGDGGFQTSAQSLSTLAAQKLPAIVIVLDNGTYGIEQWLLDPGFFGPRPPPLKPYLALNRWKYADLAKALGFATTKVAGTVPDLRAALAAAISADGPALIAITIKRHNLPLGLG